MFHRKLRRHGNSFVVTIPKTEVERLGLSAGQMLAIEVRPSSLSPELAKAFEESWKRNEAGFRYLAGR
jgi:antitoxin component of MazEF toxin-antitoxin module